jgi:hypothetical protein
MKLASCNKLFTKGVREARLELASARGRGRCLTDRVCQFHHSRIGTNASRCLRLAFRYSAAVVASIVESVRNSRPSRLIIRPSSAMRLIAISTDDRFGSNPLGSRARQTSGGRIPGRERRMRVTRSAFVSPSGFGMGVPLTKLWPDARPSAADIRWCAAAAIMARVASSHPFWYASAFIVSSHSPTADGTSIIMGVERGRTDATRQAERWGHRSGVSAT